MKNNKHNVNPEGHNQWILRSDDEIQKIINLKPSFWTKKTFRNKKILTRKETERPGSIFGHYGNKLLLSKIFNLREQGIYLGIGETSRGSKTIRFKTSENYGNFNNSFPPHEDSIKEIKKIINKIKNK